MINLSYTPLSSKEKKELYNQEKRGAPGKPHSIPIESPAPLPIPISGGISTTNETSSPCGSDNDVHSASNTDKAESFANQVVREAISDTYAGDIETDDKPIREDGYQKLDYASPAVVAAFYIKAINTGTVILHNWQYEVSDTIASARPTQLKPHKFCLCACNGSGKDAFVIAPFAIWFALTKIQSRCIITSSSGVQLTAQTETYIRNLAQAVNDFHGEEIFKIRQRYIRCMLSGSEIRLFATDEEGKAEGYHPIEPGCEMAIIINEAKSVAPEIFRALRRCTGYNYWIEVSTPGAPHGDFYKHFTNWINKRHVSTFDCPHLSEDERKADLEELGANSALYRSKHLALFTSEDGQCIIPIESIDRIKVLSRSQVIPVTHQDWDDRIGLDLAAGGDENSITKTRGNTIKKQINFREKDTVITAARIDAELTAMSIPKTHPHIYADDGGVGKAIIDMLVTNYSWTIARINNQSPASDKKHYRNRGAENWYRVKRIIEEAVFRLDFEDDKLYEQLSNRYFKQEASQGRITLESKGEAKANGRPSPDRADSFILSLTGLTVSDFLKEEVSNDKKALKYRVGYKTQEELMAAHEKEVYDEYQRMNGDANGSEKPAHNSVSSILNRRMPNRNGYNFNNN